MTYDDVPTWAVVVRRARELWPPIPGWAFELVGKKRLPAGASSAAVPIDPQWIAALAVAAACARGFQFDAELD